jgi:hypothetical protein
MAVVTAVDCTDIGSTDALLVLSASASLLYIVDDADNSVSIGIDVDSSTIKLVNKSVVGQLVEGLSSAGVVVVADMLSLVLTSVLLPSSKVGGEVSVVPSSC